MLIMFRLSTFSVIFAYYRNHWIESCFAINPASYLEFGTDALWLDTRRKNVPRRWSWNRTNVCLLTRVVSVEYFTLGMSGRGWLRRGPASYFHPVLSQTTFFSVLCCPKIHLQKVIDFPLSFCDLSTPNTLIDDKIRCFKGLASAKINAGPAWKVPAAVPPLIVCSGRRFRTGEAASYFGPLF